MKTLHKAPLTKRLYLKHMIKNIFLFSLLIGGLIPGLLSAQEVNTSLLNALGGEEYGRLMSMTQEDFDQSPEGFRLYSNDYEVCRLLIPEYISMNGLSSKQSRLLHWHLGQVHAFNDHYEEAIVEMKQSYMDELSLPWKFYVDGSIAFLERDKPTLEAALDNLKAENNQMNLEFLEKFVKYFDLPYSEAYSHEL